MKNNIISLFCAAIIALSPVAPGYCYLATEGTQILNNLELLGIDITTLKELANQMVQLEHEVTMIEQGWANLAKLTEDPMQTVNALGQLRDAIQQGQVLSYAASDLNGRMSELYPGYAAYKEQDLTPEVIDQRYGEWSDQNKDSIKAVLNAAGIEDSTIENEEINMDSLIEKSRTAEGNLQAQQVGNLLASEELKSLQRLRKLTADNSQLGANFYAKEQDKEDMTLAQWKKISEARDTTIGDGENILNDSFPH